jgi:hypothetical protein
MEQSCEVEKAGGFIVLTKWTLVIMGLALLSLQGAIYAQEPHDNLAAIDYNGIEFNYAPEAFGAVLPGYDEGTPYEIQAPYFANIAPHAFFKFMRPNPARPDTNWVGELRVYRIADLETYAELSYREVVAQLQNLNKENLSAFVTVGADYQIPALPFMPVLNATQVFRSHPSAQYLKTATGISYYTYYSQGIEPILEGYVMYTYQGITVDGRYYLSFSMPVELGLLETTIPENMDWDAFVANYTDYLQETFTAINNADPVTFAPSSTLLAGFIESISTAE